MVPLPTNPDCEIALPFISQIATSPLVSRQAVSLKPLYRRTKGGGAPK